MIRAILGRIIIPRGDTGNFCIPNIAYTEEGDVAVFSVYDRLTKKTILEKIIDATKDTLMVSFEHQDTVNLEPGKYYWDIKIYSGPIYDEEHILVDGEEITSYYSGFSLPIFEITEVAENVPRT